MPPLATVETLKAPGLSNIEVVRQYFIDQCATISKENGYRTDLKFISYLFYDIKALEMQLPAVSVLLNAGSIHCKSTNGKNWASSESITLLGYVSQADADGLLLDLVQQVTAAVLAQSDNDATKWVVCVREADPGEIKTMRFIQNTDKSGWIAVTFPVDIIAQNMTLTPHDLNSPNP